MNLLQTTRIALKSIASNRLRSILTMLGMIIGVSSVILIMGVMNGMTNYIIKSNEDMGTNSVTVYLFYLEYGIMPEDMYHFAEEYKEHVVAMSPLDTSQFTMVCGTREVTSTVSGVSEQFQGISNIELSKGRFLNYTDCLKKQNNCVIGEFIVNRLFEGGQALGQEIRINGERFTVVGVVKQKGDATRGSVDDCVYISSEKMIQMTENKNIFQYRFQVRDINDSSLVSSELTNLLYGITNNYDSFYVLNMLQEIAELKLEMNIISTALSGIAAISLFVAGIGIMNIMLVSVSERTQEIGIRKAIGAKKRDILRQFILEAGMVSGLGGVLGILSGVGGLSIVTALSPIRAVPTPTSILVSFGVAVGTGMLFGYMPAKRAARLHPMDALRGD